MTKYSALHALDWTFAEADTRGATHGVHPYPAKFIPQIPRALISRLHPGDDTAVLDPFCGSGTTLVEAAIAGAPAVGIDVNPLACLISRVKATPLQESLSAQARLAVAAALDNDPAPVPEIPALDHWFRSDIQLALAALVAAVDRQPDPHVRDALRVALSSIIVRVSNQESDTRYAAIQKDVDANSVFSFFLDSVAKLEAALTATWGGFFTPPSVKVIHGDVVTIQPQSLGQRVSLVVTSPPYPNAYEYWLYHKYRMYWLGMDPLAVKEREIGARPHFFKKNPHTPQHFRVQMSSVFRLLQGVLTDGGHVCLQVGDSVIRGELVDNSALVRAAAEDLGFEEVASLAREIPSVRSAFNPKHGRIRDETILIFRRSPS